MAVHASLLFVGPLRPYAHVIVPVFFVGFFLAAGIAIYYRQNATVRRAYVANFLVVLLVVNLLLTVIPVPLFHWHKFSEVRDEDLSYNVLRVVDVEGCELRYDGEAPFEAENVGVQPLLEKMYGEFSPEKREEIALYLLEEATEFRRQVENESVSRFFKYPSHGLSSWPKERLAGYSEFVAVRVYNATITSNADGTEVTGYSERLVEEWNPSGSPLPATPPVACPQTPHGEVTA